MTKRKPVERPVGPRFTTSTIINLRCAQGATLTSRDLDGVRWEVNPSGKVILNLYRVVTWTGDVPAYVARCLSQASVVVVQGSHTNAATVEGFRRALMRASDRLRREAEGVQS